jgi:hypothetical protein
MSEIFEVWAWWPCKWSIHDGSDLDLVVSANLEKLPLNIFLDLKDKIQESNVPK